MDLRETAQLLLFIAGLDGRMRVSDRDAQIMAQSWARVLRDVPAPEAASFVERYYRNAPQWSIQVGDIFQGCKPNPKWEQREEMTALAGRPMPEEVRDLLGRDPVLKAARRIPCPWEGCKAGAGSPCTVEGEPMRDRQVHPSRRDAAAVAA